MSGMPRNGKGMSHPVVDAHLLVAKMTQSRIADMHTFALLLVFTPAFILCMWFPSNKESVYFTGKGAYAAICVPILICALHLAQRFMSTPPKLLFIGSFWIPALVFIIIGAVYMNDTRKHRRGLQSNDCMDTSEGGDLQKAYEAAMVVAKHCQSAQFLHGGFNPALTSVMGCPGYEEAEDKFPEEFAYMKELESQHPCGGFCKAGVRLWYGAGNHAPSCRTFVQERLQAVSSLSALLMWYNIVVMVVAAPLYIYLAPVFGKLGYGNTIS